MTCLLTANRRRKTLNAAVLVSLLALPMPAAAADEAAPAVERAQRLVGRLAGANFLERLRLGRDLARLGPPAVPALVEALGHSSGGVRLSAVLVLGQINDERAAPGLLDLYRDRDEDNRQRAAAAMVLGRLGYAPAGEYLLAGLDEDSATIQSMSALALGLLGEVRAVTRLAALTRAPGEEVSRSALRALESMGDPAVDRLAEMVEAGAAAEQLLALEVLGRLSSAASLGRLEALLAHEDRFLAVTAAYRLGEAGRDAGRALAVSALDDEDVKVRAMAHRTLAVLAAGENRP